MLRTDHIQGDCKQMKEKVSWMAAINDTARTSDGDGAFDELVDIQTFIFTLMNNYVTS